MAVAQTPAILGSDLITRFTTKDGKLNWLDENKPWLTLDNSGTATLNFLIDYESNQTLTPANVTVQRDGSALLLLYALQEHDTALTLGCLTRQQIEVTIANLPPNSYRLKLIKIVHHPDATIERSEKWLDLYSAPQPLEN